MFTIKKSFINLSGIALFFFALLLCFSSCASTGVSNGTKSSSSKNAPDWVTGNETEYPSSEYITTVGYANAREKAESDAISALAKEIRQDIVAKTSSAQVMAETDQGFTSGRSIAQSLDAVSTIAEIPGVSIAEVWTDSKGMVYAHAILNRNEAGKYYKQKAAETIDTINSLIVYAHQNPISFEGYNALAKAVNYASEVEENLSILSGVNPSMRKTVVVDYGSAKDIVTERDQFVEDMVIGVYIDGDVDGRIEKALSQVASGHGFRTGRVEVSNKVVPYIMVTSFELQDVELESSDKEYVRYVLNIALTDTRTGKIILPYTANAREAHLTEEEARQRAVRAAENKIADDFSVVFEELINSSN